MCQQIAHRHSILCAKPPYVLREAARNGGPEDREAALRTLSIDNTQRNLRGIRLAAPVDQALLARVSALGTVQGGKQRTIHHARNTETLPGDVLRNEGAPATGDRVADEAYNGLGHTYDYFLNMLGRNSLDGQGCRYTLPFTTAKTTTTPSGTVGTWYSAMGCSWTALRN